MTRRSVAVAVLNLRKALPVAAGGDFKLGAERVRHTGLVEEAGVPGDLGQRTIALADLLAGRVEPDLADVLAGRDAK